MPVNRHKLHFGPYRTPRFKYGANVLCESRGELTIVGISDAKIPWPLGRRGRGTRSLVLFKSLVRAVQREAACAVMHCWGASQWLVNKWRRSLGVTRFNEGGRRLLGAIGKSPLRQKALKVMQAKARDPIRRAKIAAARRGKPRPKHVLEALRKSHLGKPLSAETRRKMSDAHKRRGTYPPAAGKPWAPWEDRLVRTLSPAKSAARTGRTLFAVSSRRHKLGLPDGRRRRERRRIGR